MSKSYAPPVAFRTNATGGNYAGPSVWVALITPRMNPAMPQYIDYAASVALFTWVETVAAPNGSQVLNPYGADNTSTDVVNLTTPEGYIVLWHQNGSGMDIYIQISGVKTEKFVKGGQGGNRAGSGAILVEW